MKKMLLTIFMFLIISNSLWITVAAFQAEHNYQVEQAEIELKLAQEITIPELVLYAYDNNPEILAAKQALASISEKYRVVTGYPNPEISVTYFPKPLETRVGPQDWNATISQVVPFPGKLSKAGEVAEVEAQIAKLNLDTVVRNISTAISQSYHELFYIQEAREIAQYNANLLDKLIKFGETKFAQNRTVFLDVVKSQTQVAQLSYDIILLDEQELTEIAKLNALLNRPPDTPLGQTKNVEVRPLLYSLDELYEIAAKHREEIRVAQAEIKKAEVQVDLAGYENLPEFKVGFFYAGIGEPDVDLPARETTEDAYGVQLGMSIPLWFGKNTSRTAGAKASVQKAKAMKSNLVNQTYTQTRMLYLKLANAERLITLYQDKMLPQALESADKAEMWFREGEGSCSDFVEAQKAAYNFQLSLARAQADYGIHIASLEQMVGLTLTD
jgi:outer membrane protein, heavy metal efflux system